MKKNLFFYMFVVFITVCPGSSDPFYIVSYYMKWVITSWTFNTLLDQSITLQIIFGYDNQIPSLAANYVMENIVGLLIYFLVITLSSLFIRLELFKIWLIFIFQKI